MKEDLENIIYAIILILLAALFLWGMANGRDNYACKSSCVPNNTVLL